MSGVEERDGGRAVAGGVGGEEIDVGSDDGLLAAFDATLQGESGVGRRRTGYAEGTTAEEKTDNGQREKQRRRTHGISTSAGGGLVSSIRAGWLKDRLRGAVCQGNFEVKEGEEG